MDLYAIKSEDGLYYKPRYGDKFWGTGIKKAKIYTKIGSAKSALALRLSELRQLEEGDKRSWGGFSSRWGKDSREAYSKFPGASIVVVGSMTVGVD